MPMICFDDWLPYIKEGLPQDINQYFPHQGDIIKMSSTGNNQYELCISACCDIHRREEKLNYLTFLKVYDLPYFISKHIFICEKNKEQPTDTENFSTMLPATFEDFVLGYSLERFEADLKMDRYKGYIDTLFKNNNPRYVFMPYLEDAFEKNIVIDLQAIKGIFLGDIIDESKSANEYLNEGDKIIEFCARLDYRYRDFVLQKFANSNSRIALPDTGFDKGSKSERALIYPAIVDKILSTSNFS